MSAKRLNGDACHDGMMHGTKGWNSCETHNKKIIKVSQRKDIHLKRVQEASWRTVPISCVSLDLSTSRTPEDTECQQNESRR